MTKEHIVKAYDEELADLDKMVSDMVSAVREQISQSVVNISKYQKGDLKKSIDFDEEIDDMQVDIDNHATRMLALRQPVAADLRKIVVSFRISNDLERIGDYAKNVAKRLDVLVDMDLPDDAGFSIARMGDMVSNMLSDALKAYLDGDKQLALDVIEADENVDHAHTAFFREVMTYMMEDAKYITACTHFMFITKNIERMGDHVTNMAEQVYYVVTGEHIKEGRVKKDKSIDVSTEV